MQLCFYLLLFIPLSQSCIFSSELQVEISAHTGSSVLLPCSCRDPVSVRDFNWTFWIEDTESRAKKIYPNDETNQFRSRIQQFNDKPPSNLSLLISNLEKADTGKYKCSVALNQRIVILTVTGNSTTTTTTTTTTEPKTATKKHSDAKNSTVVSPSHSSSTLSQGVNTSSAKNGTNSLYEIFKKLYHEFPLLFILIPILVALLLMLSLVICCAYKAHKENKRKQIDKLKEKDAFELTYADVSFKPKNKAGQDVTNETTVCGWSILVLDSVELHYADVKFKPKNEAPCSQKDMDVTYASVKKESTEQQNDENILYSDVKQKTSTKQPEEMDLYASVKPKASPKKD